MLYLRICQSVAQPYRRRPPVPCGHPRYAGRRGIIRYPRHAYPVRLGRKRPAALAFPVFCRRVLSTCGASARRPAPVRQLRDGARLVSARRIRPQPGHGGKRPDYETGKLSDLGTVPAPGSLHGMHEPQGHRRRKGTLRSRLGHCAPRRPYRAHWRAPRPFTGAHRGVPKNAIPRRLRAHHRDHVPLQLRLAAHPQP